jgi:sulfoquinovosyltransferase
MLITFAFLISVFVVMLCNAENRLQPLRVLVLVEPTPFTYISGYSNRFKEMLDHMKDAGHEVHVLTPDDTVNPPTEYQGYPITTLNGFRFFLYNHISLSLDFEGQTSKAISSFKPDIIHVSSPGMLVFPAIYYARKHR